tara:strand:+ start:1766 stop:2491 length:726 start_codon:yes stop_codon:yes gene_type:complete
LSDQLSFKKSNHFSLTSNNHHINNLKNNTITQAYDILKKLSDCKQPYSIHLIKNIPMGSGLGGGSSNAATTLKALNDLWDIKLSNEELLDIGSGIGSDVPFFINGKNQYIKGVGDELLALPNLKLSHNYILIINPNIHIDTKWAYKSLKKGLQVPKRYTKFLDSNNQVNWLLLKNDFENVVFSTYPEIGEVKEKLISRKVLYAGLSGSGSTVYGIFDNKQEAIEASNLFPSYKTYLTSSIA